MWQNYNKLMSIKHKLKQLLLNCYLKLLLIHFNMLLLDIFLTLSLNVMIL